MKKLLAIIVTALIILTAIAVPAFAYGRGQRAHFVDADKNGICDNRTENCPGNGSGFVDADNDGICDNKGENCTGNGAGFVDADNDGVCDNIGTGKHCGNGQGRHCGRNR